MCTCSWPPRKGGGVRRNEHVTCRSRIRTAGEISQRGSDDCAEIVRWRRGDLATQSNVHTWFVTRYNNGRTWEKGPAGRNRVIESRPRFRSGRFGRRRVSGGDGQRGAPNDVLETSPLPPYAQ